MQRFGHWGPSGEFQETNKKTDDLRLHCILEAKLFLHIYFLFFTGGGNTQTL